VLVEEPLKLRFSRPFGTTRRISGERDSVSLSSWCSNGGAGGLVSKGGGRVSYLPPRGGCRSTGGLRGVDASPLTLIVVGLSGLGSLTEEPSKAAAVFVACVPLPFP
jgi:hypothetical protein